MKRIAIIGSGHLGQQIAYHIHQDTDDKVVAFFDEFQEKGILIQSIPVKGGNNDVFAEFQKDSFDEVIIAIGYKHLDFKKEIFEELKNRIPFYTFVHSSAFVDSSAKIGQGSIVYPGCVIDQGVEIGENVLLNVSCSVAHDSKVGDNSFLSPCIAVAGFVNIGEQCIIGINTTIIDNINIVPKVQTGGGTVVINNLEQPGLYVGNPARFVR